MIGLYTIIFYAALIIVAFVFWLWMLIDCLRRKIDIGDKILWLLVILFANIIGAILYFVLIRRSSKKRKRR